MTRACGNIGPRERRKRAWIGAASLAFAALLGTTAIVIDAARAWRLLALPPIWLGVLTLAEARARTCVMLAARGVRNMDEGDEPVADPVERRTLMARSWSVHLWTLLLTLLVTALLLAIR